MILDEVIRKYLMEAKTGDEIAFQFIYYYSYPFITKHLRRKWRKLLDIDVEIIAGKALSEVWKSLPRYDAKRPFYPWLLTIVRRVAGHYLRDQVNIRSLTQEDERRLADETNPTQEELHLRRRVVKIVHDVLSKLKGKRRDVLILRFFQNCDYKEIVERLSLPSVEAARQLCYNALRECREILDGQRKSKKELPTPELNFKKEK